MRTTADRQYADWRVDKETRELKATSPAGATWRVETEDGGRARPRLVLVSAGEADARQQTAKRADETHTQAEGQAPRIVWGRRGH